VAVGGTVILNGSGSSDVDGNPLTYKWTLISAPSGSLAALAGANTVAPSFKADKFGNYLAQLVVNDGTVDSAPATVNINTSHTPPVANPGSSQSVALNSLVQLNGAGSTDVDGNALTYKWSLINVPQGSSAALSDASAVNPTFTAELPGTYVAQLIVSDSYLSSNPATVTITTNNVLAPTVNAGQNQTVAHNTMVHLNGSGNDPQGLTLSYQWSLTNKPNNSGANLSNSNSTNPTFLADQPGTYVAQVIASNGVMLSTPSTVTVNTTDTPPIANAGQNQNVKTGTTVTLHGNASYDPDGDTITVYKWSLLSVPPGSAAALTGANTVSPVFVPDVDGTYVAQLIVNDGSQDSLSPSTVTVAAASNIAIMLSPGTLNLSTAGPGTMTLTVPFAGGPGGQVVNLNSSAVSTLLTIPSSVLVPQNAFSTTFQVSPTGGIGSAQIIASVPNSIYLPGSANVVVSPATLSLSPTPIGVGVGRTVNGTITLSAAAPADLTVTVVSGDPTIATVISPVTIPAGNTTGTFTVTGVAVGNTGVSASAPGFGSGNTGVLVVQLGKINIPQNTIIGPTQQIPYQVSLATPAPVGGVTISLQSSDPTTAQVVPNSVFIPFQQFTPATQPTLVAHQYGVVNITASAPGFFGDTEAVQVTATLNFSSQFLTITGTTPQNVTLLLSSPAPPGGLPVSLLSNNSAVATVPKTVTFQPNATAVLVPVTPVALSTGQTTITASVAIPGNPSASLPVQVQVSPIGLQTSSNNLPLGQSIPLAVSLPSIAGTNGETVTLTSDPSKVTISPSTVTFPPFSQTASVQPTITGVGVGTATITATSPNFSKGTLNINVTSTASLSPNPMTINGAITQNATLTLSGTTATAVTLNLSSDNPAVATVPNQVTVLAGGNSVQVPVTGVSSGTATIHASSAVIPDATLSVTVNAPKPITVPQNTTVALGQSATFAISLPVASSSPVTINLASNDPSTVSVSPSSVTIPANALVPQTQPTVTGLKPGSTSIVATPVGNLYSAATGAVQVTASLSFQTNGAAVGVGATQNLTLNLSGPAPAGGLTVSLQSSAPNIASVPATVSFLGNATAVFVPVTGIVAGSATITASALNVTGATASVTVASLGTIAVPSSVTVSPSQSVSIPGITVSPAPSSDLTLSLMSSDTTIATVSQSVVVKAGSTSPLSPPQLTGVNFGNATITVSGQGYQSATLKAMVGAALSFPPGTTTVGTGATQNITLTLSAPAPSTGLNVNLQSTNTAAATVPASIAFAANATTVQVPVTGVATGSATITATTSAPNVTGANANISVASGIILPNVTVAPGSAATLQVGLSTTYPNNVLITLTSSDVSKVALTGAGASSINIVIPAGQTFPNTYPKVFGIDFGTAAISASAFGFPAATSTATVAASISFFPASAQLNPNSSKNLTLNLAAQSAAGITVNLKSDDPSVATVPPTVTFGPAVQGTNGLMYVTGVNVPVSAVGTGSTLIHASSPFTPDTTASITVGTPGVPSITTTALPTGQVNFAYTVSLTATGGIVPYTWAITSNNLPNGLSLNASTGVISGTPNAAFSGPITIQLTDSTLPTHQTATTTLTLNITQTGSPLSITTSALPGGTVGSAYSASLNATGGTPSYTWTASGLPNGLSLNTSTGVISGTPTGTGTNQISITVTDSSNPKQTASATLPLTVTGTAPLVITNTNPLPDAYVGVQYDVFLTATGGTAPYNWSIISGRLPSPFVLNGSTGEITGSAFCVCDGMFNLIVKATDAAGQSTTKALTINVNPAVLTITNNSMPNGQVAVHYVFVPTTANGTGPFTWSLRGNLPGWASFDPNTGTISGTPTAPLNAIALNFTVTDSSQPAQSAQKLFNFTVTGSAPTPLSITTGSLPGGTLGSAYSATVNATGGTPAYLWSASLPAGLSINASTGVISGTPTVSGPQTATITVKDSGTPQQSATASLSITISSQGGTPLSITTAALASGTTGIAYSSQVSAMGGTGAYSWSASGLPNGLGINPATGLISGTPGTAGTATVTVTVKDSSSPQQVNSATFSLTIVQVNGGGSPMITTLSLPDGFVNVPYSFFLTAKGGTPPYTWSTTSGRLPPGYTLNSSTGEISGTIGNVFTGSQISFLVTDALGMTGTAQLSITVQPQQLTITTVSPLPAGTVGQFYSQIMTAAFGTPPYTWAQASGALPAGLQFDPNTATISGTPTTASKLTFTINVTDSSIPTASQSKTFTLTINPGGPPSITTTSLPAGSVGTPYSTTLTGTGGAQPYTWSATSLPNGLQINAQSGMIFGTPTTAGTSQVGITLKDNANQTATATLPLMIKTSTLTINTTQLPGGKPGQAYSTQLSATGGTQPYNWSVSGLPSGLSVNQSTGVISGTPANSGNSPLTITVSDSSSPQQTATANLTLVVAQLLTITSTSPLAGGQVNVPYSVTMSAAGGAPTYTWSGTGFPAGLSINSSGVISGTPTAAGQTTASITVQDSSSPQQTKTQGFVITILPPKLQITTTSLTNGVVNVAYSMQVLATGGTLTYTWSATNLPAGLTIDPASGIISGKPTTVSSPTVNITVTDSSSPAQTASATLALTVTNQPQAPTITTTSPLAPGTQNVFYQAPLSATGGAQPYSWSATNLPAGLSINSTSGLISGNPTAAGTTTVAVTVKDGNNLSATVNLSITIQPSNGPLMITTSSLPDGCIATNYNATVAATGGNPPYSWSSPNLPSGLSIDSSTGVISGSPTANGTVAATILVNDNSSPSRQRSSTSLSITIGSAICSVGTGITISSQSIGLNLQAVVTISVDTAPATGSGGLPMTLTSLNPANLLFLNGQAGAKPTLMVTIPENSTSVQVVAEGLSLGTAVVTASASSLGGRANISIVPSGFVLTSDKGTHSLSINQGVTSNLTVSPWPLDSSSNPIGNLPQAIAKGVTVSVPLVSSNTGVGSISPTVTFTGGDTSQIALFTAQTTNSQSPQTTTLTVNTPSGFSTPAGGVNIVTATVNPLTCTLPNVTVGNLLETTAHVTLAGNVTAAVAPGGSLPVIVSTGSSQLLLSTSPTLAGSSSIQLNVPVGSSRTPDFYVIGAGTSGTAAFTANTGSAFGSCNGTVSLVASGFEIASPYGLGVSFPASVGSQSAITVYSVALDASLDKQPLAGGNSATVTVTAADVQGSGVGNMNPATVSFSGGQGSGNAVFNATGAGKSQIAVQQPSGFSAPNQFTSLVATVSPTFLTLCQPFELGFDLQGGCTVQLSAPAPASGLTVTLSSNSPKLLLSDGTGLGTQNFQVTIPGGAFGGLFFMQAFAGDGTTGTVTATAAGFTGSSTTVTFRPTGIVMLSPSGAPSYTSTVAAGNLTLSASLYQFDGSGNINFLGGVGNLAAGVTLPLTITSNAKNVGTVTSPNFGGAVVFTPLTPGSTTIHVATPPNFMTTPYQDVVITLTQ
jgi:hypothetical protein